MLCLCGFSHSALVTHHVYTCHHSFDTLCQTLNSMQMFLGTIFKSFVYVLFSQIFFPGALPSRSFLTVSVTSPPEMCESSTSSQDSASCAEHVLVEGDPQSIPSITWLYPQLESAATDLYYTPCEQSTTFFLLSHLMVRQNHFEADQKSFFMASLIYVHACPSCTLLGLLVLISCLRSPTG